MVLDSEGRNYTEHISNRSGRNNQQRWLLGHTPSVNAEIYDIQKYLDMVSPLLDLAYNTDWEKIAVLLTHLGKDVAIVTGKVRPELTWNAFRQIVIDVVQPPLGAVDALSNLDIVKYEGNLDETLT